MDVKDSLCAILDSLLELKGHTARTLLIDFINGHESEEITKKHLDELETFGCGDKSEDINLNAVIDQAITTGYLKSYSNGLGVTAKGKKYLKSPTPFILHDDDDMEETGPNASDDSLINSLVDQVMLDKGASGAGAPIASQRSMQRINLIRAIDRKLALDEYAEQEGILFEDLLDELEAMQRQGKKIDIRYFGEEVLGNDCLKELFDYFDSTDDADLREALDEYGDVYNEAEIRIARIIWKNEK